ncbi:MAG: hypothetical protein ACR2GN_00330 [Bacteroidia bacterium]
MNLSLIGHAVDFSTGAIYKPCDTTHGTTISNVDPAPESPND